MTPFVFTSLRRLLKCFLEIFCSYLHEKHKIRISYFSRYLRISSWGVYIFVVRSCNGNCSFYIFHNRWCNYWWKEDKDVIIGYDNCPTCLLLALNKPNWRACIVLEIAHSTELFKTFEKLCSASDQQLQSVFTWNK